MSNNSDSISRKRVAIIGGGVSGLTAGIYALKYGYDVDIYEKNPYVGGLCTGWRRQGTYIDGCIHWLTESNWGALYELWKDVGALADDVRVHHYDAYCQVQYDGQVVNFFADPDKLEAELLKFAATKNDQKLMKQFAHAVRRCKANAITVHKPYHLWRFWDVIRFLVKIFGFMPVAKKLGKMGIDDLVAQLDSPVLKFAFANNVCPDKYSVFSLASTYGGIVSRNSGVPVGGSKAFAERMRDRFESLGGKIHVGASADEFVIDGQHVSAVRMADGSLVNADFFISACDVHYALAHLFRGKFHIAQMDQRDARKDHFPVFSCFVVTYRTRANLAGVNHNRYVQCQPYDILGVTYNCIYVKHFEYDELLAGSGGTVVQSLISTSEEQYDQIAAMDKEQYKQCKANVEQVFRSRLQQTVGADYGDLELLDIASPLTFNRYTNAYKGSFMTYMFSKYDKQMIVRNDILPLDNLALGGHWMMVPGGLPVAAMQGKFAAMTIDYFCKHGRDVRQGDENVNVRSF